MALWRRWVKCWVRTDLPLWWNRCWWQCCYRSWYSVKLLTTYFKRERTISCCLITRFNTRPRLRSRSTIMAWARTLRVLRPSVSLFGKPMQSCLKCRLRGRIFKSRNNCDSTDLDLPPLQFQLFTFLRALCITRRDWLWFLKQNSERLTSRCDVIENVTAGQSARRQTKATNYIATNHAACRFACILARVEIII